MDPQWAAVRAFALTFPNAFEDFPWGLPAVKVATGAKFPPVFLWLGDPARAEIYVKLTDSYDAAVSLVGATPTTLSGVGQFGRLTIRLPVPDVELLHDWIDESYRNVAPRRLVAALDALRRD